MDEIDVLIAENSQNLQKILDVFNTRITEVRPKINTDKIKLLVIYREDPELIILHVDSKSIGMDKTSVQIFRYSGKRKSRRICEKIPD